MIHRESKTGLNHLRELYTSGEVRYGGNFNPGRTKILQAATLMDVLHIALPSAGKGQARKAGRSSAQASGIGLPLVMPAVGEDDLVGEGDAVAIAD